MDTATLGQLNRPDHEELHAVRRENVTKRLYGRKPDVWIPETEIGEENILR